MKKVLLLGFFILSISLFGQKYRPIDSNMVWNESSTLKKYLAGNQCCYELENSSFQFEGFVLNNGNIWLKLFKSALYSWAYTCSCNSNYLNNNYTNAHIGYILNDSLNKKVYFTPTLTANFVPTTNELVYDFLNKNIGDSLLWRSLNPYSAPLPPFKYKIADIDSLFFNGKYHKKYTLNFNGTVPSYSLWVVEGIGTFRGTWNSFFSDFECVSILKCFSNTNQSMFVSSYTSCISTAVCGTINSVPEIELPAFSISPNPVSNILTIKDINVDYLKITDIFGKIVLEQNENTSQVNVQALPPGLYMIRLSSENGNFVSKFIKE